MFNDFGKVFVAAAVIGLVLLVVVLSIAIVLARLSWRWSRPGASFGALAFPICLPLLGIICAIIVRGPVRPDASSIWARPGLATPIFVGFCTLAGVLIWGRALWLRPGADLGSVSVRQKRRQEIVLSAAGAGCLYLVWLAACWRSEQQAAQSRIAYGQQEATARVAQAADNAAWVQGRIAAAPRALCYSPDGRYLATVDTHLQVWDLATGKLHRRWDVLSGNVGSPVRLHGFDDDGTRLAVSVSQNLEIFDCNEDRKSLPATDYGRQVRFWSAQDAAVVFGNGKAEAFDVHTGKSVPLPIAALHDPDIATFAVSRDAAWVATWSPRDNRVATWRADGSKPSWTASDIEASEPIGLAFSNDGQWLALATSQNQIVVWNAATGAEQLRLEAGRRLKCFAFSADGTQIVALSTVSAGSSAEPQIHIWNLPAGLPVATHSLPHINGNFMALSPDGREMAAVDREYEFPQYHPPTVRRFDTATGLERRGFPASSP